MSDKLRSLKANAYDTLVRIEQLQRVLGQLNGQIKEEMDRIEAEAKTEVKADDNNKGE